MIPKSLYKSPCKDSEGSSNVKEPEDHHNIYNSVELKPGEYHELIIENSDPSSVLTWDFDVLNSNVLFNVYRTGSELPENTGKIQHCELESENIRSFVLLSCFRNWKVSFGDTRIKRGKMLLSGRTVARMQKNRERTGKNKFICMTFCAFQLEY